MKWRPNLRRTDAMFLLIIIAALTLRCVELRQYVFMDELINFRDVGVFLSKKTIIPASFFYPTFYSYLITIPTAIGFLILQLSGEIQKPMEYYHLLSLDSIAPILPGRLVSLTFGIATIVMVYHIGKKYWGRLTGILAATFLSFSSIHIQFSAWAKNDTTLTFFAACVLLYSLRILCDRVSKRDFIIAGLLVGATVSLKYTGVFVYLPLVVAGMYYYGKNRPAFILYNLPTLLVWSAGAAILGFILTCPAFLLVPDRYLEGLEWQRHHVTTGHIGFFGTPYVTIFLELLAKETTLVVGAVLGIGYALLRRADKDVVLLAMIVPPFVYIGSLTMQVDYYLLFLYPALALLTASLISAIVQKASSRNGRFGLLLVIITLLFGYPFSSAIAEARQQLLPDNRWIAMEWIHNNIPPGSRIVVGVAYLPPYILSATERDKTLISTSRLSQYLGQIDTYEKINLEFSDDWVSHIDAEYIITSTESYETLFTKPPPPPGNDLLERWHKERGIYEKLLRQPETLGWERIKDFHDGKGKPVQVFQRVK